MRRLLRVAAMALLIGAAIQVVLLSPVEGSPDRGILPPVDQQAPAMGR